MPGATRTEGGRLELVTRHALLPTVVIGFGIATTWIVSTDWLTADPGFQLGSFRPEAGLLPLALGYPMVLGTLLVVLAVLITVVKTGLARRRDQQQFDHLPVLAPDKEAQWRGRAVRFTGEVRPRAPTFRSAGGRDVVLARYLGVRGGVRGPARFARLRWEMHAVDFVVVAPDGREVLVNGAHLRLLPFPPERRRDLARGLPTRPHAAWIYEEDIVAVGDIVEVAGVLDVVTDAGAPVSSDRQPRLSRVLRGDGARPVCLRRGRPG
jgi:hypothetical protein